MSLVGYKVKNHPQQVGRRGARPEIDDRQTPPELFDPLHRQYRFTLDAAASSHNAKVAHYYDKEQDGLDAPWLGERVWCNPPHSNIAPWLAKAWWEWPRGAQTIVMLLPANRTEQGWWQEHVEPFRDQPASPLRVRFLAGRTRFIAHDRNRVLPNERPPYGCCLLIWEWVSR